MADQHLATPPFCAVAAHDKFVIFSTSAPHRTAVTAYDMSERRWLALGDVPVHRRSFAACALPARRPRAGVRAPAGGGVGRCGGAEGDTGCSLVTVGGYEAGGHRFQTVEEYVWREHRWRRLPDMLVKRAAPAVVCLDGDIVVMGGFNNESGYALL